MWYPFCSQKPGRSSASSSNPRTHLALFQKYRCGTRSRAGQPCSGVSHSPLHLSAIKLSGRLRWLSGRLVVNPCSAKTRQYCAAGFTPARSSSSGTGTPSNVLSSRLHVVTQWISQTMLVLGSSSSSSYEMENGRSTSPDTVKVQVFRSERVVEPAPRCDAMDIADDARSRQQQQLLVRDGERSFHEPGHGEGPGLPI